MQILKQEFSNIAVAKDEHQGKITLVDHGGYNPAGEYSMDIIQNFITNSPNPIIIMDGDTRRITMANTSAILGSDKMELIGEVFEEAFPVIGTDSHGAKLVYLKEQFHTFKETDFDWDGKDLRRVEFLHQTDAPDNQTLETWKKMIAVMLHRFRSPLTGVSGYLDLLKDNGSTDEQKKQVAHISDGIDRVFDIMDELETLHNIPTDYGTPSSPVGNLQPILDVALLKKSEEEKKRIQFTEPEGPTQINCNPASLKIILDNLIQNALDHNNGKVQIEILEHNLIRIHNEGTPIEQEIINNLFYPFITTKATNLGIGLTMALMHARQFKGSIFLSENSTEKGISFDIYFPH
jgi:K+-sensing histidine kinase KdpD